MKNSILSFAVVLILITAILTVATTIIAQNNLTEAYIQGNSTAVELVNNSGVTPQNAIRFILQ